MTTNKETLKIIAMGPERADDAGKSLCCGCAVTEQLALKAAENFAELAKTLSEGMVARMVDKLEEAGGRDERGAFVSLLAGMFERNGMEGAAAEVRVVHLCAERDPDAYFVFEDVFFENDVIDWFCVENWLNELFPERAPDEEA